MDGKKRKPTSLITVPGVWKDTNGRPFMIDKSNENKYAAGNYDGHLDQTMLALLGVKVMDERGFYDEMMKVLRKDPGSFLKKKSQEWHASLARALSNLPSLSYFQSLPIIPLSDGTWVAASSIRHTFIHLPSDDPAVKIPSGIEIPIVDAEAAADLDRNQLFIRLGILQLEIDHIKSAIIQTHSNPEFKPDALLPTQLVSHAEFMFQNRESDETSPLQLWMASDLGSCRRGTAMYLPSKLPSAASNILPRGAQHTYGFLHPMYLEAGGSAKTEWLKFLRDRLGITTYPRMQARSSLTTIQSDAVHEDFQLIITRLPSQKWLTVLKDGWEFYRSSLEHQSAAVVRFLRTRKVNCTGSPMTEQLCRTYAPINRLTKDFGSVAPFLDIPDANDPNWEPLLDALLVNRNADFNFYLACLRGAKKTGTTPVELIRRIMHELEDECSLASQDRNLAYLLQ